MEDISGSSAPTSLSNSRYTDDRASLDSGISSRGGSSSSSSAGSGSSDERSGSRSSALSGLDEILPSSHLSRKSPNAVGLGGAFYPPSALDGVRGWRDHPNLLLVGERSSIRHVDSVQHQTLLMSHPAVAAGSPSSSSSASVVSPPSVGAPNTPAAHYPPPAIPMITPHPLHHQLPPPNIYSSQIPEMLWKQQRFPGIPLTPAHLHSAAAEELMAERERAYAHDRERQDRMHREREQEREIEKHKEREREKHQELQRQEKDRLEKQRAEQAVREHFTESLKLANQKRWNLINSLPPPPANVTSIRVSEDERKRMEHEQRLIRPEPRERDKIASMGTFSPYAPHVQISKSLSSKNDYINSAAAASMAQSRVNPAKSQMLPKSDPGFNMYGYPAYQPPLNFIPQDKLKNSGVVMSSMGAVKSCSSSERDQREILVPLSHSVSQQQQSSDVKNSVIVKNDGKQQQQQQQQQQQHMDVKTVGIPAHSSSPKLRVSEHYLQPPPPAVKSYEYRSPSQSPLQAAHATTTSPHQLHVDAKLHHRQGTPTSGHHRQSPLPSHHRHSPHQRQSPLPAQQPSPMSHHRHSPHPSLPTSSPPERYPPGVTLYQKPPPVTAVSSYSYQTQVPPAMHCVTNVNAPPKQKVSSPAPHHIYGKPGSGITSGTPVCRSQEISLSPVPASSKGLVTPSPYQQLSQLQLPPSTTAGTVPNVAPPPAHSSQSSRPSSVYGSLRTMPGPNGNPNNHRPPVSDLSVAQTQPLDLGVKEQLAPVPIPPVEVEAVPTELTKRKWTEDSAEEENVKKVCVEEPVLDRVTEPSPLIANAATTITTVINVAVDTPISSALPEENIAPPIPCSSPNTPAKLGPSTADSEKSNSPKPPSYSGHKLKKAWLQRHSGEDVNDEKPNAGKSTSNGSLSINDNDGSNVPTSAAAANERGATNSPLSTTVTKDTDSSNSALTSLNNSLNSIGSMAVNSISKARPPKGGKKGKDRSSPVVLNGHVSPKLANPVAATDESSSSDADTKSSPKRVPPKVKRKKYAALRKGQSENEEPPKRKKLNSTSSTDSDKESASEKDSDNSSGKKTPSGGRDDKKDNSRKRGRRPKVSGGFSPAGKQDAASSGGNDGAPKEKKFRDESKDQKDPFPKPPVSQLKKTGESFLQDGPCFEVAPKLAKCRECRWTPNQRSRNNSNIFCRFYAFRRLRYTKNGQLAIAGFSDPHKDAKDEDLNLWLPNTKNPPTDLDLEMARFMLAQVGDQFCDLLTQEAEAINIHISEDKKIAWKRVVQGVREMCDVCETTLFNFHWACSKCGFVVCIDCYKGRKNGTIKIWGEAGKDRDDLSWLLCTNRQPHEQEKLMLTQIIAGDSLMTLAKLAHESRAMWDVAMYCGCTLSQNAAPSDGICKEILRNLKQEKQRKAEQVNGQVKSENGEEKKNENDSPLNWLADVALSNQKTSADDDCESSSDSDDGNYSTLRELLVRPNKTNGNSSQPNSPAPTQSAANSNTTGNTVATKPKQKKSELDTFDEVISHVGDNNGDNADDYLTDRFLNGGNNSIELKYFVRSMRKPIRGRDIPIRIMTITESKLLYPEVPHAWLCDGKLLRLLDPDHPGNYIIFQDQWKRGQPVIVSDVTKRLDPDLWHPDSFAKDFGDIKNDLINCMTGKTVPNQPMRKFWEGFEYQARRLKDDKGQAMLLKLKDWPPGEDFAEMLPSRYQDLMTVLPLGEYTQRNGKLNLASRLPECFVRPDLGPKMYNAYGSAMHPKMGTTNLHLDISDAVNVMVYVGIPEDGDTDKHMKEAYRAIDEAGCDFPTRRRAREKDNLPGALWHIYSARDADKIRDLLNKVAIERGARLEPNHDPIHDQSWYLDGDLRDRLHKEYSVEGYAIVQCLGDAVFVPAGTPHQVRNLLNCIKVAEDFVSPENVSHCFHLTQEFRDLSDTHSNHEDKLQIKNIMYHAVKDSLSVLGATLLKNSQKANGDESKDVKVKSESSESSSS